MSAFSLLSKEIQEYIRDKGWKEPRPIQDVAIRRIIETEFNYVLSSKTASGKTEAAFLPALTLAFGDKYAAGRFDSSEGVRILYISPLIALINDQMLRMEELCAYLGVTVTKWHGEANASAKRRLLKEPEGVVLMTPESLEAMFQNKPEHVAGLFAHLDFVIIDEVHYFLGTDRGAHLRSLLHRLRRACMAQVGDGYRPFRWIGLSATIGGDKMAAKEFMGDPDNTKVLVDKSVRETEVYFRFVPRDEDGEVAEQFYDEVYARTKDLQTLVFPNSRAKVEVTANKLLERAGEDAVILAHHASLTRKTREDVEETVKNAEGAPFTICCTSTLELGIDLPSVDRICQLESVPSVSSLAQRTGRSGRSSGKAAVDMLCTLEWNLLRNVASWNLCRDGNVEAPDDKAMWYNVLLHQMLSVVAENTEESADKRPDREQLADAVLEIPSFRFSSKDECLGIIGHLLELNVLEEIAGKLSIGPDGERLVRKMNSYVVFATPFNYKVFHDGACIGELEPSVDLKERFCFMLAARKWEIVKIDKDKRIIDVKPAMQGKKPQFISEAPMTSVEVEQEMKRILMEGESFEFLQNDEALVLGGLQQEFAKCGLLGDAKVPYKTDKAGFMCFYPFAGTKVSDTLALLLGARRTEDYALSMDLSLPKFLRRCKSLLQNPPSLQGLIMERLQAGEIEAGYKYFELLPSDLQAKMLSTLRYDYDGAMAFLEGLCSGADIPDADEGQDEGPGEGPGEGPEGGCDSRRARGRKMQGKVAVYALFVSDGGGDPELNRSFWNYLREAEDWLAEKAGGCGKEITFVNDQTGLEQSLDCEIAPDFDAPSQWRGLAERYLESAGFDSVGTFMNHIYSKHGCERAALVIVADAPGRSFAVWGNSRAEKYGFLGSAMIYAREDERSSVLAHELLHLFGAIDLYDEFQSASAVDFIRENYPHEIMQCTEHDLEIQCMSPLTTWLTWLTDETEPWFDRFSFR